MKIKITNFALRHFDKKFGGTKILNYTTAQVEEAVNVMAKIVPIMDGYAPFCKLLCFKNTTDARIGSMKMTLENYQYIRSGYSARTESELPVFSRWLELPLSAPKAEYLMFVLYSREQLLKEFDENKKDGDVFELSEDIDFGVVAILGQETAEEEPMKPETMLRNALGIKEGGSGVTLDREKYNKSVAFWSEFCTVK